ncbi:MAG: dual specificity protein phosphatase family protein [Cystobacterineae bacterium]|nr:dual specificity protein phosphatase family protein [Cystobacterineae bacterium]
MHAELQTKPNYFWKILAKRGYAMWLKLQAQPNINPIRPFLWLGGAYNPKQLTALYRQGIRAIADLRAEHAQPSFISTYPQLHFRRFPISDRKAHTQEELLQIVLWVLEQTKRHCHTLVHCQHGIGRAPLVVACVLLTEGLEASKALLELECLRWQVRMNKIQLRALQEFSNTWMRFLNNSNV